jgi:hypothetical protein
MPRPTVRYLIRAGTADQRRVLGQYGTLKEATTELQRQVRAWRYYGVDPRTAQPYDRARRTARYSALKVEPIAAEGQRAAYRLRCNNRPAGYLYLVAVERLPLGDPAAYPPANLAALVAGYDDAHTAAARSPLAPPRGLAAGSQP